jgi:hypothetical protein
MARDLDSISAIMRAREGRASSTYEACRALFVTTNIDLQRACSRFFENDQPDAVPPCVTDYFLATLLWLKKPFKAPALPMKRIIADCYAATQPDEYLWRLYMEEIDRLERAGGVTPDDVFLLRHALEAKHALMELTGGVEDAFTQGTVQEVLDLARARMQAEVRVELDAERNQRLAVETRIAQFEAREIARRSGVRAHGNKIAAYTAKALVGLVGLALLVGTLSTLPWGFPPFTTKWMRYLLAVLQAALLAFVVLNLVYGTTAKGLVRGTETALSRWLEKKFLALLESLAPDGDK